MILRPRRAAEAACAWPRGAQKQQALLDQFRAGALNLLISTAVAEEGLDLTRCALVRCRGAAAHARCVDGSKTTPFIFSRADSGRCWRALARRAQRVHVLQSAWPVCAHAPRV